MNKMIYIIGILLLFSILFGCTDTKQIKINDLNTQVNKDLNDLNVLQFNYNQLQQQMVQLIIEKNNKDQNIIALQTALNALNLQIVQKTADLNNLQNNYQSLLIDKNSIESNDRNKLNDLNTQILLKTNDLNILQINYHQLQLDKNNLEFISAQKDQNYQIRLNDLNIQLNLLTTQKNNLQLIINDLNSRLIEKTINLNTLQLEYNNLLAANDLNIAELNELQSEINLLTIEKTDLQNSLSIMSAQLIQITADNLQVKTNYNNLLVAYNIKTAELATSQAKYLDAITQKNDINNRYFNTSVLYRLYGNDMNIYDSFNKNFYYYNRGIKEKYSTTMYGEINDYLTIIPSWYRCMKDCNTLSCQNNCGSRENLINKQINEFVSQSQLSQISNRFKSLPISEENKVRSIANMVQQIDYFIEHDASEINGELYPYQVLYIGIGVCGEKSNLLINLLKNMGYKTAYIYLPNINHAAVGIGCSGAYEFHNSGYCYIESTGPNIISDFNIRSWAPYDHNLLKNTYIKDTNYIIYPISDGIIYNAIEDYNAALYYNFLYSQDWNLWKNADINNYNTIRLLWGLYNTDCYDGEVLGTNGYCR